MQIPVLIEPVAGNGFRARGSEPFALSADGATRDEALASFREQLRARLRNGAVIVPVDVPMEGHPLAPFAGMFSTDDPLVREWIQIMAENRREADQDSELP